MHIAKPVFRKKTVFLTVAVGPTVTGQLHSHRRCIFVSSTKMKILYLAFLIVVLVSNTSAIALRALYFAPNGGNAYSLRVEAVINEWWTSRVNETLVIAAGTRISNRTSANHLVDTDWTLPADLSLNLRTSLPSTPARLGVPSYQ